MWGKVGGRFHPARCLSSFFEKGRSTPMDQHGTPLLSPPRGTGSFKKRTRIRKRDGKQVTYYEGYVYASDGKKVYGSGATLKKAQMSAIANLNNYTEAMTSAARQIVALDDTRYSSMTLGEATDRYVGRTAYRFNTRRKYLGFGAAFKQKRYFSREIGRRELSLSEMLIAEITLDDLEDFIRGYRSCWTETSTYNIFVFIRQVFKHAKKRKWIPQNPAEDVEPRKKVPKTRIPMPAHVMDRLLDLCEHPQLKAFLLLSTYALRAGESAGLTSRSIQGDHTLHVMYGQAWMENDLKGDNEEAPKTTLGLEDPKSVNAFRAIEIHPNDWWIIERSLEDANEDSVLTYDLGRRTDRFILNNAHGGQWRTDHIRRALRKWLSTIKDEQMLLWGANLPHNWRVSVITNLLDGDDDGGEGLSLPVVSRFAGHARTEITGNIYYRSTKKAQIAASRAIGARRHKRKCADPEKPLP